MVPPQVNKIGSNGTEPQQSTFKSDVRNIDNGKFSFNPCTQTIRNLLHNNSIETIILHEKIRVEKNFLILTRSFA